ncbi:hypothetical protein TNCV_3341221 [Trichonephila clavipes]|nr:hypothetical protein TNCV_3341221 [Trichonephila clavipes]
MIVQFRNEKVSNHGSIPITIDCNVVAFIVFKEEFHQPIKRAKQLHTVPSASQRYYQQKGYLGITLLISRMRLFGQLTLTWEAGRPESASVGQTTWWSIDHLRSHLSFPDSLRLR